MHLKVVASESIAAEVRRCFPEQECTQETPVDVAILELGAEGLQLCERLMAPAIFLVTDQSALLVIATRGGRRRLQTRRIRGRVNAIPRTEA